MKSSPNDNDRSYQCYVYSLKEEIALIVHWQKEYDFWDIDEQEILQYAADTLISKNNYPHTKCSIMPMINFQLAADRSHPAIQQKKKLIQQIIEVLYCSLYRMLCYGQHYNQQGICHIANVKLVGDELHLFIFNEPGDYST